MKTRVLIVDDHRVFRDVLKTVINHQADIEVVGEAENGEKAIALSRDCSRTSPHGCQNADHGRDRSHQPDSCRNTRMKILALSIYADDDFMALMMRAGALGYILKGCDPD